MTLLTPVAASCEQTAAEKQVSANWEANLSALSHNQPDVVETLREVTIDLSWVFARDGSLTAMRGEQWWEGCSLPVAASRALLKSLESNGQMSCFLAPTHAGLLIAARDLMGDEPALVAVVPEPLTLAVILSCHDFSAEILSHHLWIVTGEQWVEGLAALFRDHPGLPTPQRFIKTKLTADDVVESMIGSAQRVFGDMLNERAPRLESIRAAWPTQTKRDGVLLIAGSHFRLWDDGGDMLAEALGQNSNLRRFNCDDPSSSSPLALAETAADCKFVVASNIARGDAANLVSPDACWITWVTRPQIPAYAAAAPLDRLILADANWKAPATAAGWPANRISLAGWPAREIATEAGASRSLAILADIRPIEIPGAVEDLSSHRVLWEQMEAELRADPLAMEKVETYIEDRCRQVGIDSQAIDRAAFIEGLIVPAYQQGLARLLIQAGLPLRIYGRGWKEIDEFRAVAAGSVVTRAAFKTAVSAATALVYTWPQRHAHPIDSMGKPVVARPGRRRESFVREAKLALQQTPRKPAFNAPSLGQILDNILAAAK